MLSQYYNLTLYTFAVLRYYKNSRPKVWTYLYQLCCKHPAPHFHTSYFYTPCSMSQCRLGTKFRSLLEVEHKSFASINRCSPVWFPVNFKVM